MNHVGGCDKWEKEREEGEFPTKVVPLGEKGCGGGAGVLVLVLGLRGRSRSKAETET
jgi:hypothetical protein